MIYVQDADFTLHQGDCLEVLRTLPDRSVHMCCTSPPFYGLRDYDVDGQIGLEDTPDQWVTRLVDVFREVRRVIRDDGTLWVEIGDSYAAGGTGGYSDKSTLAGFTNPATKGRVMNATALTRSAPPGLKPKDLLGQPWALAFALRADGWWLRSEIIWAKPNPMPESVTDRPTKAHSTVFLLAKQPRYYFDAAAIREPSSANAESLKRARYGTYNGGGRLHKNTGDGMPTGWLRDGYHPDPSNGANARSVWTIATEPTPFAHFATWPQKLCARMILAGTSEHGCCPQCGAPWQRETATPQEGKPDPNAAKAHGGIGNNLGGGRHQAWRDANPPVFLGWRPSCHHDHQPVPCRVLDPFGGSGTTALVARSLGRRSTLIELSADYCQLAAKRLQQLSLLTEAAT